MSNDLGKLMESTLSNMRVKYDAWTKVIYGVAFAIPAGIITYSVLNNNVLAGFTGLGLGGTVYLVLRLHVLAHKLLRLNQQQAISGGRLISFLKSEGYSFEKVIGALTQEDVSGSAERSEDTPTVH